MDFNNADMLTLIMSFSFYPQGSWLISGSIKGQIQLTNGQKKYDIYQI